MFPIGNIGALGTHRKLDLKVLADGECRRNGAVSERVASRPQHAASAWQLAGVRGAGEQRRASERC